MIKCLSTILTTAIALPSIAIAQPLSECPINPLIEAGLEKAIALKKIKPDGALPVSVREYLAKVKACAPQEQALAETGVKLETIQKLEQLAPKPIARVSVGGNHAMANAIVRGLTVANRTGEIGANARLSYQIQSVVRRLRRGDELSAIVGQVGVSESIVNRLLVLGGLR